MQLWLLFNTAFLRTGYRSAVRFQPHFSPLILKVGCRLAWLAPSAVHPYDTKTASKLAKYRDTDRL